jgi:hypothetical protein
MVMIAGVEYGPLEDAQKMMCDQVDEYRNNLVNSGAMINGALWDVDPQSQTNIVGVVALATALGGNLPSTFPGWRDKNNIMHPMTGAQVIGLGAAVFAHLSATYYTMWAHKAAIKALTDINAVYTYDYTTNWPA